MFGDVVFAVASPPGMSERGLIRVSGPTTFELLGRLGLDGLRRRRCVCSRALEVLGFEIRVLLVCMPGPGSYTGEDVVELHAPGSPLLLARIGDLLRAAGARDATPGEFTRRAFEHGRLDLAQAEAVGELIHAESQDARRRAVGVLEGGIEAVVGRCRNLLQDGLALLEAGLDFEAEDSIGTVAVDQWLPLLERAQVQLAELGAGLPAGSLVGDIVMVGAANAGKSSLCNALVGANSGSALVSAAAGTTRDVLSFELCGADGVRVSLLDAPGDQLEPGPDDASALALRDAVAVSRAAAALWVVDARAGDCVERPGLLTGSHALPLLATVRTHLDLVAAGYRPKASVGSDRAARALPDFQVSCTLGTGIADLKAFLLSRRRAGPSGPSGANARITAHVAEAEAALERAISDGRTDHPAELIALSVGEALLALDAIAGRSEPDDLLDRIFGSFCLGK